VLTELSTCFIFTVFSIYKLEWCLLISKQPSARCAQGQAEAALEEQGVAPRGAITASHMEAIAGLPEDDLLGYVYVRSLLV